MNIPGRGICIVISDINPNDFVFGEGKIVYGGKFSDVMAIANEIRAGRKIAAIKEVRAQTGWGLKEAKQYIDEYTGVGYGHSDEAKNIWADKFIREHSIHDEFGEDDFKL